LDARLTTLLCKKLLLRNPKSENRMVSLKTNLAESSKEGYGLKKAVMPVMMMMMMDDVRYRLLGDQIICSSISSTPSIMVRRIQSTRIIKAGMM
jgi:hypothetical protein